MLWPYPNSNLKVDHPTTRMLRCQENKFFASSPQAPTSRDISECHAKHLHSLGTPGRRMLATVVAVSPKYRYFPPVSLSFLSSAITGRSRTSDLKIIIWILAQFFTLVETNVLIKDTLL